MALKALLESIDDLSPEIQALYTEQGGKFFLDLEDDIKNHPKTVALKNALDRVRGEKDDLKTKLTAAEEKAKDLPDDFTADEWLRLKTLDVDDSDPNAKNKRKEKEDERLAAAKRNYEQQILNLTNKITSTEAELKGQIEKERNLRASDKASIELEAAMNNANIDPRFREAVRALHRTSVKHVYDEDTGELNFHVDTDLGPAQVADYINNWSKSEAGKPYVAVAAGPVGRPGERTNISGNPFAANGWNKTEQAALRADPTRGERLAQAAGFKNLAEGLSATRARPAAT